MKTRLSRVLACLFAGILTVTAADYSVFAEEETPEIKYYVCPNSKILKEDETDYSEMTANGTLLFSAAANERESAQIILTKEGEYKNFALQLEDDLTDDKDNSIPKENFEIYFEHYIEVEKYWELKIPTAKYPDALIPEKLAEKVGANTFTLDEQKKNQGIWFTVTIPPGTPAGTYEGKLTGSLDVNVEVKVYDFELPALTSSCTAFRVRPRMGESSETASIKNHIGIQNDEVKRQYQEIFSELLNKRKISSGYIHSSKQDTSTATLEDDVEKLYKFITDPKTKSPYYDLSYLPDVYRDEPAPIYLNCKQSADEIVDDFKSKSGVTVQSC